MYRPGHGDVPCPFAGTRPCSRHRGRLQLAVSGLPNSGTVEPGTYTLSTLNPSPVITLGEGWWAGWDYGESTSMPDGIVTLENELSEGFVPLALSWEEGGREG